MEHELLVVHFASSFRKYIYGYVCRVCGEIEPSILDDETILRRGAGDDIGHLSGDGDVDVRGFASRPFQGKRGSSSEDIFVLEMFLEEACEGGNCLTVYWLPGSRFL